MRSALEVRNLFNTRYQNINSGIAPGYNDYEISIFLTQAKKEIIDSYASINIRGGIDETERVKKHLSPIVKRHDMIPVGSAVKGGKSFKGFNTYFVKMPNYVWRVLEEECVYADNADPCAHEVRTEVQPTTWDMVRDTLENAFRRPTLKRILRMDADDGHYLISKEPLKGYVFAYLEFPKPYIITDLSTFMSDYDYEENGNPKTIDGVSSVTLNELDNFMDDLIIGRAVELATLSAKENSLSTNISLNQRSI